MFNLPKSFSDNTLHALSLEDLFNPLKNEFFVSGTSRMTNDEVERMYRAIYTRENILNNYELFFPQNHIEGFIVTQDSINTLINPIPNDDLWLLGFFRMAYLESGNKIVWEIKTPRVLDYNSSNHRLDMSWQNDVFRSQYSYQGTNFLTEIAPRFLQVKQSLALITQNYPLGKWELNGFAAPGMLIPKLLNYCSNRTIYSASDFKPETLRDNLLNSPTVTFRVTFSNSACKVSYVIPITKANKSALHRTLSYSADVLDLLPWPLIAKGENEPLLYGVELEVSTRYDTAELIEACDEPFFACKQDSSISGSMRNKVELVTAPTSMKMHKAQWSHFFSNLDYDKFDTTIETNNGMHVHIGRKDFTDAHLRSFAWFFGNPSNKDFIVALSERKESHMHKYSALPDLAGSRVNSLKTVVHQFDMLRGAVNLHKNKPTVEVRIFKGIASYATILKNLEAVDAIYHFTQQCSSTNGGIRQFLNFLRKTPRNKYPVLKEFVATLDTKRMLSTAELNDLLFNVKDPRKIVAVLDQKKFPITSHHVSVLNAKQGVRTFIFNKEHGTIEIVRTKHGKMSHLDRVLEKRYVSRKPATPTPLPPSPPHFDHIEAGPLNQYSDLGPNEFSIDPFDYSQHRWTTPRATWDQSSVPAWPPIPQAPSEVSF